MYLRKVVNRIFFFNLLFIGVLKVNDENSKDPGPDPLVRGMDTADPDPYQNVMDPQHWFLF
jgi:hypothetical protein